MGVLPRGGHNSHFTHSLAKSLIYPPPRPSLAGPNLSPLPCLSIHPRESEQGVPACPLLLPVSSLPQRQPRAPSPPKAQDSPGEPVWGAESRPHPHEAHSEGPGVGPEISLVKQRPSSRIPL